MFNSQDLVTKFLKIQAGMESTKMILKTSELERVKAVIGMRPVTHLTTLNISVITQARQLVIMITLVLECVLEDHGELMMDTAKLDHNTAIPNVMTQEIKEAMIVTLVSNLD